MKKDYQFFAVQSRMAQRQNLERIQRLQNELRDLEVQFGEVTQLYLKKFKQRGIIQAKTNITEEKRTSNILFIDKKMQEYTQQKDSLRNRMASLREQLLQGAAAAPAPASRRNRKTRRTHKSRRNRKTRR
jgi:hypothetical protein